MTSPPSVSAAPASLVLTVWWQMLADCLCVAVFSNRSQIAWAQAQSEAAVTVVPCEPNRSLFCWPSCAEINLEEMWGLAQLLEEAWISQSRNCPSLTVSSFAFQLFHVAYVLIKFANSPRPDLWVLERSVDNGRTFTPWQYFAREFIKLPA